MPPALTPEPWCLAPPLQVLFGEEELSSGTVKVKGMEAKTEDVVALQDLVPELQRRIAATTQQP